MVQSINLLVVLIIILDKKTQLMQNSGVFYSLLERVGGNGRYQDISMIIWSLMSLTVGAASFYNPFLFQTGKYECSMLGKQECRTYVCSLPVVMRTPYANYRYNSLATDFGYDGCSITDELSKIETFVYLGGLLGLIVSSFFSDFISKKKLLLSTLMLNLVGIIMTITSSNLMIAVGGLFLNFACKSVQFQVLTCFITQSSAENRRGKDVVITYLFYGVGVTLNGAVFYFFDSWKMALIFYQILPFLICLVGILLYIEQTPFDLITYSTPEQAQQSFSKIALINNRESDHKITVEELAHIKQEYKQNKKQKHDYIVSFIDLFKYKSLRFISILLTLLTFCISLQFYMPQLVLSTYDLDIYVNGIILGSSQIISSYFSYIFINKFERKSAMYWTSGIAFLCSFLVYVFTFDNDKTSMVSSVLQTIGIFLYRFCTSVSLDFYSMVKIEVYPTQIRSIGLQINGAVVNIMLVVTPIIKASFQQAQSSIILLFSMTSLMVIALSCALPETKGIRPPEIIDELQYKHEDLFSHNEKIGR